MKSPPHAPNSIEWRFHADDAYDAVGMSESIRAFLCSEASSTAEIEDAVLIAGELIGNVGQHAPGEITITIAWGDGGPELCVEDRGPGLTELPHFYDLWRENGRGFALIHSLAGGTDATIDVS